VLVSKYVISNKFVVVIVVVIVETYLHRLTIKERKKMPNYLCVCVCVSYEYYDKVLLARK
jgi:hypothetical protein